MNLEFYRDTAGAEFLFDDETADYIVKIYKESNRLAGLKEAYEGLPVGEKRSKLVGEHAEILKWLLDQPGLLPRKFAPFLAIRHRPFPSGFKFPR